MTESEVPVSSPALMFPTAQDFVAMADCLPELAWMADSDGWIFWYNRKWYEYTGATPGQMAGWGWQSVPDPAALPDVLERWKKSIASGEPFEMVFPLRGADGVYRPFLTRAQPFHGPTGRIERWFGANTDISEQQKATETAAEEKRLLQTLNRTASLVAAELDLAKLVQIVIDAGVALTGAAFGAFFYNVTDESGERYTLYAISDSVREAFAKFPMPRNTGVFGPTFRGERIVRADDITKAPEYGHNPPFSGMPEGHPPVRSYLAAPVVSRSGEVLGGLFFGHPRAAKFTANHEELIVGIAGQAAIGIDNARLFDAAQREIRERREVEQH
ncbi:MAG TPA: GAF domain-containing protein, partial [Beijerinckiaceae bacterium]|nr:GAF domain-containing protein [Beijerinckiaceae bacterium]